MGVDIGEAVEPVVEELPAEVAPVEVAPVEAEAVIEATAEISAEVLAATIDEGEKFKGLDAPNGEADDLKKISGVGPVLEKKLNDMGIFHFSQIAEFTLDEISKVDDELNFKGRIERDDWMGQAKAMMEG